MGLDGRLESSGLGEVRLALEQLAGLQPGDVALNDRGFTGYRFLAEHQHPKQVNRANSYHALKQQLLDLLYRDIPAAAVIGKLQRLFVQTPVSVRPDRKVPRRKPSFPRSYHFQRRVKKVVF